VEVTQGQYFGTGFVTVNAQLNGGSGVNGGNGGYFGPYGDYSQLDCTMNVTANGGTGTTLGGTGGQLETYDYYDSYFLSGTFTARGGMGMGASGDGGTGGVVDLYANEYMSNLNLTNLNLDVRGGDSQQDNGGDGGTVTMYSDGTVWIAGGTWDASGGTGSTVSGTGQGGLGGTIQGGAYDGAVIVSNTTMRANGGNGRGDGGNSNPATAIHLFGDYDSDNIGGFMSLNGTFEANGGSSTGTGNGGNGGNLRFAGSFWASIFVGELETRGTYSANGGNGQGAASMGGNGGEVYMYGGKHGQYQYGTVNANGGGPAGNAGTIFLNSDGAGVTTTGATLQTNNGMGVAVPSNITIN
jgi:hypothetical protein